MARARDFVGTGCALAMLALALAACGIVCTDAADGDIGLALLAVEAACALGLTYLALPMVALGDALSCICGAAAAVATLLVGLAAGGALIPGLAGAYLLLCLPTYLLRPSVLEGVPPARPITER